jgi:hypothetical protein
MIMRQNAVKLSMSVVSALLASAVFAQPGGEPLILDTQTGIHSGAGGTVLQTGPLTSHEMVQAPSLPTVPGSQQQNQPIIEVTPYIGVPQQGGRSVGNLSGVPSSSQKRSRTTSSPAGVAPVVAAPIAVTPMVSATQATQPSHSTDPHMVNGAVTAPRQ